MYRYLLIAVFVLALMCVVEAQQQTNKAQPAKSQEKSVAKTTTVSPPAKEKITQPIAEQSPFAADFIEHPFDQRDFVGRRGSNEHAERYALTIAAT